MIEAEGIALFENLIGRSGPTLLRWVLIQSNPPCWFDSMDRLDSLDTIRLDTFGFLNLIGERDPAEDIISFGKGETLSDEMVHY